MFENSHLGLKCNKTFIGRYSKYTAPMQLPTLTSITVVSFQVPAVIRTILISKINGYGIIRGVILKNVKAIPSSDPN